MTNPRNNGSYRRRSRLLRVQRQVREKGLQVVTWNCAGVSLYKIFLLLEFYPADVVCLQETWLKAG